MRRRHDDEASLERPFQRLVAAVSDCWQQGWQPADLMHVVRRDLRGPHRQVCAAAIAADAGSYRHSPGADPAWLAQVEAVTAVITEVDDLDGDGDGDQSDAGQAALFDAPRRGAPRSLLGRLADVVGGLPQVAAAITAALALLRVLPPQPRLCPPPSEWGTAPRRRPTGQAPDPKVTERVRALLAKAESTTFPDEAEAFTAKAQELIARHAIDLALLEGGRATGDVVGRRVLIDDPYASAKSVLASVIARANGSRGVFSEGLGFSTVFGTPSDLDAVELLYASLLTQATASMTAAGRRGGARARGRAFRQSFLLSFAYRIGERLEAATAAAVDEARSIHGDNVLPVLASRDAAAEEARDAAFPRLHGRQLSTSSPEGWIAGRAAADLARLGPEGQLRGG